MRRGTQLRARANGRGRTAIRLLLLASLLGSCSSLDSLSSSPPRTDGTTTAASGPRSFSERISNFISGPSAPPPPTAAAAGSPGAEEIDCPRVDIRQGASTLVVSDPNATSTALGLRYQGTFTRTARECILRDKMVTIRVGVQGRVLVGPAGGPGQLTIPLRFALVKEGIEPKVIYSKLYPIPVSVPSIDANVTFSQIEEAMVVPMPSQAEFDAYVIYIGFDPQGAQPEKPQKKPAAKGKTKAQR
jgi:hypothetical protein